MIEVESFKKIVTKISKEDFMDKFQVLLQEKWFSAGELETYSYPKSAGSLAGRYLIKKALADQLESEFDKSEIEILNNEFGKPEIKLGDNVAGMTKKAGISDILCSISHSRNFIAGMTILCY